MVNDPLQFERPVVLLGGGHCDNSLLQQLLARDWPLVAADGGANRLAGTTLIPDAIIGDLDSLANRQHWESCSQVVRIAEQDTTDFEKCLYSTGAPVFVAMGFTGKRFDHTLAALNTLLKYADEKKIVLITESDVVVVHRGNYSVTLPVGCRFSLFPLDQIEFADSSGLEYSLQDVVLTPGGMIGCSNRVTGKRVTLSTPDSGAYCVIVPLSNLDAIVENVLDTYSRSNH